ncbi:hypothetical protein ON010_g18466 [Phytophthora cinnamomi]|nr:hypothetical protein ON010_g18466 [Phytophthora cinnamomi]
MEVVTTLRAATAPLAIIRILPARPHGYNPHSNPQRKLQVRAMAISDVVQSGLFEGGSDDQQLIRIPIRADEENKTKRRRRVQSRLSPRSRQLWTTAEHHRFLEALELYPSGPWKVIADHIGTRTARQAMTHAQKYREKIERRKQKQRSRNVDGILFKASSKITAASVQATCAIDPVNMLSDDATEHAVLMEFVENFQPSEIDHVNPFRSPRKVISCWAFASYD